MKAVAVAVAAMAFVVCAIPAAKAQNRLKDCAAQWSAMKAAQQTEGKTYRSFQKECMSKSSALAKEAGADDIASDKPKKKRAAKADAGAKTKPAQPVPEGNKK